MKWFQVDADTPNDPKIRAIVRDVGLDGLGGLFLIWCHIADHGAKRPGWSIDSRGQPLPEAELIEVSRLSIEKWRDLVSKCVQVGHFLPSAWKKRKIIALPAMSRRADTYTKRQMRSDADAASNGVRTKLGNSTVHTKQVPPYPPKGGRQSLTRRELEAAKKIRDRSHGRCPHDPQCKKYVSCVELIALERRQKAAAS